MQKAPELTPSKPEHLGPVTDLHFKNVSFRHQSVAHKAIDDISFTATKGETIAFVGPSGSGKTTLMKLLVGLYRPQEGNIFYNGLDENSIDFNDLRNQIGFVTQDTQLFSGTIKENLLFVNPGATDNEVLDVIHKAAGQNLLSRADLGIDTVIGEGGLKLSGGERQRLSIARALLRDAPVLILDEPTSALDTATEASILSVLRDSANQRTTLMIAHRLSTVRHADRIIVLERGAVIEEGTHDELLRRGGIFANLYHAQMSEPRHPVVPMMAE
jgi:ATP-binding cassette subfamily B protein